MHTIASPALWGGFTLLVLALVVLDLGVFQRRAHRVGLKEAGIWSAFWVLLSDTIAGAMMLLSVTGLLLWTRLHPLRLAGVATVCGALLGTVWVLWSGL